MRRPASFELRKQRTEIARAASANPSRQRIESSGKAARSIPCAYTSALSMNDTMASTYKRHARSATGSDTDRVPLDEWPELGSQRLLGHQVNGAAEQVFEIELETEISA